MALAQPPHYNPNFMLDLECISVNAPNPVLMELGIVHFDLDTGAELSKLKLPINLQSCLDRGLVMDDDTARWVQREIPNTLATSKSTKVTLDNALDTVTTFIDNIVKTARNKCISAGLDSKLCERYSEPRIWGNGAVADNVWLRSAYAACGKKRPWKFTGDMCVRTFVTQAGLLTGRNFPGEVKRQGRHHDALDDCRHQIRYLIRARKALMSIRQNNIAGPDPAALSIIGVGPDHKLPSPRTKSLPQQDRRSKVTLKRSFSFGSVPGTPFSRFQKKKTSTVGEEQSRPRPIPSSPPSAIKSEVGDKQTNPAAIPSPELIVMPDGSQKTSRLQGGRYSFDNPNDTTQYVSMEEESTSSLKRKRVATGPDITPRPGVFRTPETSFSGVGEVLGDIASPDSDPGNGDEEPESSTGLSQTIEGMAIITPETSFSRLEEEFGCDDTSRSPSPESQRLMLELV